MFEKEAEEYVMRDDVVTENDRVPFDNGYGYQTVDFEVEVKKAFQDGAEFGYNKAKEELEAQIEKMKCGQNCKYEYWKNTGGCYDQKCRFTGLDCTNCKDKWEVKEND